MAIRALEAGAAEGRRGLLSGAPRLALGLLALAAVLLAAAGAAGWIPRAALLVAWAGAVHGGMIAAALLWASAARARGQALRAGLVAAGLLALAEAAVQVHPALAVLYLATPAWLLVLALAGRLEGLGLRRPLRPGAVALGLGVGAILGGHLLAAASTTPGYGIRTGGVATYLAAVAYDVGANVPSGELFFRGALLDQLQRRWAFAPAAVLTTGAWVLRYLLDPRLPGAPEVLFGALVYLSVLGGATAWLFRWSGSLLPSLAATGVFFAAYRLLRAG